MMVESEAHKRARIKYDSANTMQIKMKLNMNTDKDVIEALEAAPTADGGKQGYIKRLIREDIQKRGLGEKVT